MPQAFPHLFAPLELRHKTLKHRLNFGARTTNMAEDGLIGQLAGGGLEVHAIGDCAAPRRANNATYEGRKLGLKL